MNNATRLRRLNHMVTVLKAIPRKKFNMDYWGHTRYFNKPQKVKIPSNFIFVDCRTVGCALGWMAMDKKFRKAGLRFVANLDTPSHGKVYFKGLQAEHAGKELLGINYEEAESLFVPNAGYGHFVDNGNIKPRHVITRVKKLIKKYEVVK